MKEYRVEFLEHRGVNVEANSPEEASEIVLKRRWEYGMDFKIGGNESIEIEDVKEI